MKTDSLLGHKLKV